MSFENTRKMINIIFFYFLIWHLYLLLYLSFSLSPSSQHPWWCWTTARPPSYSSGACPTACLLACLATDIDPLPAARITHRYPPTSPLLLFYNNAHSGVTSSEKPLHMCNINVFLNIYSIYILFHFDTILVLFNIFPLSKTVLF